MSGSASQPRSTTDFLTNDWSTTWVDSNRVEAEPRGDRPNSHSCPCCRGLPAGTGQYRASALCDPCYQKAVRFASCVHR